MEIVKKHPIKSALLGLSGIPFAFFKVFVFSKIYTWYIEVPYHTVHINLITWYGIMWIVGLLTMQFKYEDVREGQPDETIVTKFTYHLVNWILFASALFFAWAAKAIFM